MNMNEQEKFNQEIELTIEEIEAVIAPGCGLGLQHNETLVSD